MGLLKEQRWAGLINITEPGPFRAVIEPDGPGPFQVVVASYLPDGPGTASFVLRRVGWARSGEPDGR